ncbi:MAG TPA: PilZ domain-containing protein [Terriglobales bacterium]|nr:PilZ domain-containing protein [Terriglobales bacterium]
MSASPKAEPQATATVALIGLSQGCTDALRAAFRQFSIDVAELSGEIKHVLENRKFQGCVVRLEENSAPLVEAVRKSSCNRTIPVIGVCPAGTDMRLFGRFGLNAILKEPVDRQEALKMVRGTHLLILNELRRYVRIPMVLEVQIQLNGTGFAGLTRDISYGGISINTQQDVSPDNDVELALTLPNGVPAKVKGSIIWRHHPDLIGIRFAAADDRRATIRKWIDDYFQMV